MNGNWSILSLFNYLIKGNHQPTTFSYHNHHQMPQSNQAALPLWISSHLNHPHCATDIFRYHPSPCRIATPYLHQQHSLPYLLPFSLCCGQVLSNSCLLRDSSFNELFLTSQNRLNPFSHSVGESIKLQDALIRIFKNLMLNLNSFSLKWKKLCFFYHALILYKVMVSILSLQGPFFFICIFPLMIPSVSYCLFIISLKQQCTFFLVPCFLSK